jgi:MoxR-like ATPase
MTEPTVYSAKMLGLHGLEDAFRAAHLPFLVVDDVYGVVAFQGQSGTAKTTLSHRLGILNKAAGGGDHGIYSADKVQYEDFLGMPVPDLEHNRINVIPIDNAISTKEVVLVDELNRASYENQEKFLSLFASRRIDGKDVLCKYIYVAMNPVMTAEGDSYDGTQPLDKALGERIMFLVNMPTFSQLPSDAKLQVIKASHNQTKWTPTEELVTLHRDFIAQARQLYAEVKETYLDIVAEYVCEMESQLRVNESGLNIEGRRAQFMLTNILGLYAINKAAQGSASLKEVALEGMQGSFPDPLWYKEVSSTAIKAAHDKASQLLDLDISSSVRSFRSESRITRAIKEINDAVSNSESVESISKLITMHWPRRVEDPAGHFVFAYGVTEGLTPRRGRQTLMKENEFKRMKDACTLLRETTVYKELDEARKEYINTGTLPEYVQPEFISNTLDPAVSIEFDENLKTSVDYTAFIVALMEECPEIGATSFKDFSTLLSKASSVANAFLKIRHIASENGIGVSE